MPPKRVLNAVASSPHVLPDIVNASEMDKFVETNVNALTARTRIPVKMSTSV